MAISTRRAMLVRALFSVLLVAGFAMLSGVLASGVNDDAYIAFRYARNLAEGHGLVFQLGERVEGFTSFSWVMISALFARVGLEPSGVMPLLGLVSAAILIVFVAWSGRQLAEEEGRPHEFAGVPAAIFVAITPSLAFYAATGLETALAALLQTLAAISAQRRRPLTFAIAAGLALLTRPEAAIVTTVGAASLLWHDRRTPGRVLPGVLALAALAVPFAIFKLSYFGQLLPNTFSAKPPNLVRGVSYAAFRLLPLVGFVVPGAMDVRRRTLFVIWAASFVGVALEGGDWMAGSRMVVPSVATLALAGDRTLLEWARPPNARKTLIGLAGLAILVGLWGREALLLRSDAVGFVQQNAPRAELTHRMWNSGVRSVGTLDIGIPGYVEPGLVILDLGGLTDRTIGRAPGNYDDKALPMEYIAEHPPDAFVLTARERMDVDRQGRYELNGWYPVETKLSAAPWFHDHYRPREAMEVNPILHIIWFEKKK